MSVCKQHQGEILRIIKEKGVLTSLILLLLQSNEILGSTHMEKEDLIRCVTFLQQSGFTISKIVADRHKQIGKWIREELPSVKHEYDVWHVAKGEHIAHYSKWN